MKTAMAGVFCLLLTACGAQTVRSPDSAANYGYDMRDCQLQASQMYPVPVSGSVASNPTCNANGAAVDCRNTTASADANAENRVNAAVSCMVSRGWRFEKESVVAGSRMGLACKDRRDCGSGEICSIRGNDAQGTCHL